MTESEEYSTTVVIRRPKRVETDDRGRSIWAGDIEETELDLMSSQDLKLALRTANDVDRESIRAVAESDIDGIVARDRATGLYEVISEAELQELMDKDTALSDSLHRREMVSESTDDNCADELSLVSTQVLRRMLTKDESDDSLDVQDDNPGFDPYDKG